LAPASQSFPPKKTAGEPVASKEKAPPSRPSAAALRALAEADERRRKADKPLPREISGRDGPDPVRYGDWEVKGLASDF
jgi:hypothetical protein